MAGGGRAEGGGAGAGLHIKDLPASRIPALMGSLRGLGRKKFNPFLALRELERFKCLHHVKRLLTQLLN